MTELITIMVIVGILAAVAIPRLQDNDFSSRAAADQVKAVLRYAQKIAIAAHNPAPVVVTIRNAVPGEDPVCGTALEAGGGLSCVLRRGVTLGGNLSPSFDAMGRPVPPGAPININVGGIPITIEAETGYVH